VATTARRPSADGTCSRRARSNHDYTTGARPPLAAYRTFDPQESLYDGPIDGWFAIYHRSILPIIAALPFGHYFFLGAAVQQALRRRGLHGLLDTGMKVFHVVGPAYAAAFGMLEFEIEKYRHLGRQDIVQWYTSAKSSPPSVDALKHRVEQIVRTLDHLV
jgi:hypothetical protein